MARRRHDAFSKDLLSLWCEPVGRVEASRRVHGEERQIDVLVTAERKAPGTNGYRRRLGLLGRMAKGVAAFEAFRNPCTADEVRSCLVKLFELYAERRRRARRRGASPAALALPKLWVLTPSCPAALLAGFGARQRRGMPAGCFDLADELGTTLVVLGRLPATAETLWLRLLGRGAVQRRAIAELWGLPEGHPLRRPTARRVLRWRREAEQRPNPTPADRELIMNSERWVTQWEQSLLRKGKAEGKAEGLLEGKAEGLRAAVLDLCEVLGVELTASRRAHVGAMEVGELEALRRALKQTRRWPRAARAGAPRVVKAARAR
jgi:hypothetical protein